MLCVVGVACNVVCCGCGVEWSHSLSITVVALSGSLLSPNPTLVLALTVTWYTCAGVRPTSEAARDFAGTSRVMEDCPTMEYSNW